MPLPVQRLETLEHDVKNERKPERSTCPHVPSPDVDRTSCANGQSSVLSDPADASRMLAFALTGVPRVRPAPDARTVSVAHVRANL
jgi:hypothetical protein